MAALLAALLVAVPAGAVSTGTAGSASTDPNGLRFPPTQTTPPPGHRQTAKKMIAVALAVPKVAAVKRRHPGSYPAAYLKGTDRWQVSLFDKTGKKELAQVALWDYDGRVLEAWTGFQVAWTMARGYPGAFGKRVNALYIWIPLCLLFIAPFIPRRRRDLSMLHLDLLVILSLSISFAFFNHGKIGLSVPLAYPPLLYLLWRLVHVARKGTIPRRLPLLVPVTWLAVATVFLIGFRIGLNATNSNVIDVGYAGVIGADKLAHGHPLYGSFPADNPYGDTYGPANYYAYFPFERVWHWSGRWDDVPAAHVAATFFDLLTLLGLFLLGRRIRGPTLGIVLAYGWAANPFTLFCSNTNSNDALVSALLVLTLLVLARPIPRGFFAALAGLTKFAPLGLVPLLARPRGDEGVKKIFVFGAAFAATAAVVMLPVLLDGQLHTFWDRTISYQASRGSPFSVWGLWGTPGWIQHLVQGAAALFALGAAFWPRGRDTVKVAALAGAILIALQLGVTHWFYLYIVWFLPLALVGFLGRFSGGSAPSPAAPEPARLAVPA